MFLLRIMFKLPRFLYLREQIKRRAGRKATITRRRPKSLGKLFLNRFPFISNPTIVDEECQRIELATTAIEMSDTIKWSSEYKDIEDTFALNRFGWLLTEIHTRPSGVLAGKALKWINSWIDEMAEMKKHPAWESYSVAERLANWPFILSVVNFFEKIEESVERKLAWTIEDHLEHLSANRELKGRFTNNHILNNARGLYIGAFTTGNDKMLEEAKGLFKEWIPKLIDDRGMLKEDSTHYQLLVCQRIGQVLMLARETSDEGFVSFLERWLNRLEKASAYFHVLSDDGGWSMPLIGDVSPDFPPDWLSPLSARGWKVIRDSYHLQDLTKVNRPEEAEATIMDINDRFFRYSSGRATIFWHVPDGQADLKGHGHFDTGGFILFLNGVEVFADPGRESYGNGGAFLTSAAAHTGVSIKGVGAFCEDSGLNLMEACSPQRSHVSKKIDGEGRPVLTIQVDGFRILTHPVGWTRSFTLEKDRMMINDSFDVKGTHEMETRFLLAADCSVEKIEGGLCIKSTGGNVILSIPGQNSHIDRTFSLGSIPVSRKYGHCDKGTACAVSEMIEGICSRKYEIMWGR